MKPLLYLALLASVLGCNSREDKKTDTQVSGSWFATIQGTILQPKCVGCHSDTLSSYSAVMRSGFVVPGNPEASELYQSVISGRMPKGASRLADAEIGLIEKWIRAGAPENNEPVTEPEKASFQKIHTTTLQRKCLVCHNTQKPRGKFDASSYETVLASTGGKVKPVVLGEPEKSSLYLEIHEGKMPPQPKYLDEKELEAVFLWIKNGALEKTPGALPQPPQGQPNPPQPTYEWLNRNLFPRRCGSCHGIPMRIAGIDFSTYTTLMESKGKKRPLIVPGDPEASGIYVESAEKTMPPAAKIVSHDEVEAVRAWILDGAKNN